MLGSGPNVLVVNPQLPVKSVKELIALAKQQPGEVQYASAGVGSFQHLGGELFKLMAGVNMLHVPFKGGGPAMIDVIGGHTKVHVLLAGADHAAHQVRQAARARRRRRQAQSGSARRPDHRRGRRARLRGDQLVGHRGAGRHARRRSSRGCTRRSPPFRTIAEVQKQFANEGASVVQDEHRPSSASIMVKEMNKWERVVKEGGIKAE